jgi:hypothetical protein
MGYSFNKDTLVYFGFVVIIQMLYIHNLPTQFTQGRSNQRILVGAYLVSDIGGTGVDNFTTDREG